MDDTTERKQSALATMLDMMDVPEMRKDVTKPSNVGWLRRNLAIQNGDHPMFTTAMGLVIWLARKA
jgi:hypothetical protein